MSKRSRHKPALDLNDGDLKVELIAIKDDSSDAKARGERVEMLIAKIILLGHAKSRPRKEESDEIAA